MNGPPPDLIPLPRDADGPVFREPWEAQSFAMAVALYERGLFTWPEWAAILSDEIARAQTAGDPDRGDTYYHHWQNALERIVAEKGLADRRSLMRYHDAWNRAADRTPHGTPIELRAGDFTDMAEDRHPATPPSPPREKFDPAYARRLDDPERFRMLSAEQVIAFVDAPPGGVVVDYGAGTGTYAVPFARARPDCRIVAIDIEPQLLDVLRSKSDAATIRTGGPELLAELTGTIDRLFSLHVMHYLGVDDLRRILAALAPGGRAAFVDWNADAERPRGPAKDRLYGAASAERLLASAGFIVERILTLPYHYAFFGRV